MNCDNCGTANDAGSKYCKECGNGLPDSSKTSGLTLDEHLKVGEFIYLAYRESEAGHLENAIKACEGALAINHANPATHSLLASLYDRKGDLARAIYEYERVVSLEPGSLEDRRKLEQLRARLLAPIPTDATPSPKFRLGDIKWLRNRQAAIPWITAILTFGLFVLVGGLILRGGSGKNGGLRTETGKPVAGPTAGIPGQPAPYGPGALGPNQTATGQQQPGFQQPQQDQEATGASTPADKKAKPGIPAVRPGAGPQPLVKPQDNTPGADKPIITPILGPTTKPPANATPPKPAPLPPSTTAPAQSSKNAEQRGVQLHRMGKYDDAISAYKEALNQTSDPAGVYQKMAMSYQRMGQHDAAIDNYNRGIKAYRDQLASGRSQTEVQNGIRACEAGIEVSRNMK